jgi:cytochrome b561
VTDVTVSVPAERACFPTEIPTHLAGDKMTTANHTAHTTHQQDATEYDGTAKFLHWLAVALIGLQFPVGMLMPPTGRGEVPAATVNMHFSIGMVVLVLFTVRLGWRLFYPVATQASLPVLQKRIAHAAHSLLYALTFATLLAGWAHASVRGWPIKIFGLCPVPPICEQGSEVGHFIGQYHSTFAWALLALISTHLAGVVYHQFVQGDRILERMLPSKGSHPTRTYAPSAG